MGDEGDLWGGADFFVGRHEEGQAKPSYGACPKSETSRFFLFFSAHWPSAAVR